MKESAGEKEDFVRKFKIHLLSPSPSSFNKIDGWLQPPQNKSRDWETVGERGSTRTLREPLLLGTQWTEIWPLSLEIWKAAEIGPGPALTVGQRQVSAAYWKLLYSSLKVGQRMCDFLFCETEWRQNWLGKYINLCLFCSCYFPST